MCRLDDEHLVGFKGISGFVLGNEDFVKLFPWTDPDVLHRAARGDRFCQVGETHAWNLRNKDLSAVHLLQAMDDKLHALLERQPEAGHARIGYSNAAATALLQENGDYAASATHNVPIARATEPCVLGTRVGIRLHEHLFGAQFRRAIQVDWIYRLVGAERQNPLDALIDGGIDHVAATHDVGLDSLKRVVLASRHLLERSRVNHDRHSGEGPLQAIDIAHVPEEITQAGMIKTGRLHFVLLQFVP